MTTKVETPDNGKSWNVLYSNNGKDFKVHKRGFKTMDEAIKETTIINGSFKLLKDVLQNK